MHTIFIPHLAAIVSPELNRLLLSTTGHDGFQYMVVSEKDTKQLHYKGISDMLHNELILYYIMIVYTYIHSLIRSSKGPY